MATILLLACTSPRNSDAPRIPLEMWVHSGRAEEREALHAMVADFNRRQSDISVHMEVLPEGSYNGQIQAAALADDLPDIVEFDGPYVSNYVWQGKLRPLDTLLPQTLLGDLLPSIRAQGRYRGRLYAVGMFDSGLGLYGRRSALERIGAAIPATPNDAWDVDTFDAILDRLAAVDTDGRVIDLKTNYNGEWYAYGFSPAIQSAGGDLIERREYRSAEGVLDSPAAVAAMSRIQAWFKDGRVDPNLDDDAFVSGRVALSWVGHWEFARYHAAFGDDLAVMPLPDFGHGTRSGQGSWNFGITTASEHPKAAARLLAYLLDPPQVLKMCAANGAVPATLTAVARSPRYAPSGPLHLFADQLKTGVTVSRPVTPAYPIISSVFERAFRDIQDGAPVQATLSRAARVIDADIRANRGYPWLFEKTPGVP